LLQAANGVRKLEDTWFSLHVRFEIIWRYRSPYRALNDLLCKKRRLKTQFQGVRKNKTRAVRALPSGMSHSGAVDIDPREVAPTANSMVVALTHWLSCGCVRDPRHALQA